MARPWTKVEESKIHRELHLLYVTKNLSINEIAKKLSIAPQSVYQRLIRLNIPTQRHRKAGFNNLKRNIVIPSTRTPEIAELFGVMLGDGHISHFQTFVTLGTKELSYVEHVRSLIAGVFRILPSVSVRKSGFRDIYLGSVQVTAWLREQGLVTNKVVSQVGVPDWISTKSIFMKCFLRGFFDTDGSIYKLRHGVQLSFTNLSRPILDSSQKMLFALGYTPSKISSNKVYLTRVSDIERFFKDIRPKNSKHTRRYEDILHAPVV